VAFTVADYIVRRRAQRQVDTLFGVPAAYCSPLFDAAIRQGMRTVVTASDLEAGYAAGGYARTKGLGAAAVAYGVGALSMINAIAGGFVERSPVVVVNGAPALRRAFQPAPVRRRALPLDRAGRDRSFRLQARHRQRRARRRRRQGAAAGGRGDRQRDQDQAPVLHRDQHGHSACPMPAGALPVANRPTGTESALAACADKR